ncbi:hypothetical protein ABBQ38_006938 [Trebouxia sp. C0009 RCD-2024]
MENSRTLLDFTRQPGLKYLRNEHVRLDVRVTLSVAARSALVDAVVVHQESQVAAAFVRLPGPHKDHAFSAVTLLLKHPVDSVLQKTAGFPRVVAPWPSQTRH